MKANKTVGGLTHAIHFSLAGYIEIIFIVGGTFGLYIFLAFFSPGGVVGTDVMNFMNLSLNGLESTYVYPRYFHILLERIFLKIAPTPLLGAQWYWAFLITASALLIYLCGRLFSPSSRPLHGLMAVVTFLSIGDIAETTGTPGVDLTAMFMIALLILVYLLSARRQHRSRWLIALFGFFLYLAFRTKETCLPAGILVFGFGFTEQDQFNWTAFAKNLLMLLSGFLAGLVFFALCMWNVVGDPLFGLRLSEFKEYLAAYAIPEELGGQQTNGLVNWFNGYFFTSLLLPFVLYILSGLKTSHLNMMRRWVWTLPLAIILFVSATIGNRWGLGGRFVFPVFPAICLLWPQSLDLYIPRDQRDRNLAGLVFCGGLAALAALRLAMRIFLPKVGSDTTTFLFVVFYPLLLACILLIYSFSSKLGLQTSIIISVLVISILVSSIDSNFKLVSTNRDNQKTAAVIFYPFSTFSKQIVFTPQMRMYISTNTWSAVRNPYYTKNIDEVLSTFNVYFDASSTRSNFTFTNFYIGDAPMILSSKYAYILLAGADWQTIANNPGSASLAQKNYQVFFDPRRIIVLLKAR